MFSYLMGFRANLLRNMFSSCRKYEARCRQLGGAINPPPRQPAQFIWFLYGIDPGLPYVIHLRYPVKAFRNEASPWTERSTPDSQGPRSALLDQHPSKQTQKAHRPHSRRHSRPSFTAAALPSRSEAPTLLPTTFPGSLDASRQRKEHGSL